MITVYLDTSFYIDLEQADPRDAEIVASAFYGMGIRPVVSNVLIEELLQRHNTSREQTMLDRIARLPQPLRIPEQVSWDELRLLGEERVETREMMISADRTMAISMSLGISADRVGPAEAEIIGARFGVPTTPGPEMQAFMQRVFQGRENAVLSEEQAQLFTDIEELVTLMNAPDPDWQDIAARAAVLLAHPDLLAAERESRIASTLAKNDRRAHDVALGSPKATPKILGKIASLRRDARHMHVFIEHRDQIDYLQVDGVRLRQMQHDEKHDLRVSGVDGRCFAAAGLKAVLGELERLSRLR